MPPRQSQGQSSFSVSQESQQVVCPLKNQDGTNCRKRCLGEKRYRSMQEHIRRAHPEHYISKLPATEESFQLMISTPPSARPPPQPPSQTTPPFSGGGGASRDQKNQSLNATSSYGSGRDHRQALYSSPSTSRPLEDQYPAAATAAVALAQLHTQKQESEWGSEADAGPEQDSVRPGTNSSYDLPPIQNQGHHDPYLFHSPRPRELLPSMMSHSPPGRSTTLPPIHRPRPRKGSVTQNARKAKHERTKSKEYSRRMSIDGGRKAFSAEPPSAATAQLMNKRWEDLIEAATSANEADSDRDLTPIPQSPSSFKRASLPPFPNSLSSNALPNDAYKASPLQRALTPPPPSDGPEPFPSVESSLDSTNSGQSGINFHMRSSGLLDSSPSFTSPVQIYCAKCRRPCVLKDSYACNECISGFCADCVYQLTHERRLSGGQRGQPCPQCRYDNVRYKQFRLDFRI